MRDHWPLHARQWALVESPLRPVSEDIAFTASAIADARRVMILGVTPELVALGREVIAVDRSSAMIEAVFPRRADARAVVGDWRALPLATGSIDAIAGDGALSTFTFPYSVLGELARVLVPGGRLALRLFAAPTSRESLADVAAALAAGAITNFHALKWRVAMALLDANYNVAVAAIHRAFANLDVSRWDPRTTGTLDVYRASDLVYSFPPLPVVIEALAAAGFAHLATHVPRSYELAERCPTVLALRK